MADEDAPTEEMHIYLFTNIKSRREGLIGGDDFIWAVQGAVQEREVRLLDYACGKWASASSALEWYTNQSRLIDDFQTIRAYNQQRPAHNSALRRTVFGHAGSLINPETPHPQDFDHDNFRDFDIAAVTLRLSGFPDPKLAVERLAERLREGGVFFVVDYLVEETDNLLPLTGLRSGFSESEILELFKGANLEHEYRFEELPTMYAPRVCEVGDRSAYLPKRRMFIARGEKMRGSVSNPHADQSAAAAQPAAPVRRSGRKKAAGGRKKG